MSDKLTAADCGIMLVDGNDNTIIPLPMIYALPTAHGLSLEGELKQAIFTVGRTGRVGWYPKLGQYGFRVRLYGFLNSETMYCMFDDCYEPQYLLLAPMEKLAGQPYALLAISDYISADFKLLVKNGAVPFAGNAVQRLANFAYSMQLILANYPLDYASVVVFDEPDQVEEGNMPRFGAIRYEFADESEALVSAAGVLTSGSFAGSDSDGELDNRRQQVYDSVMNTTSGQA